MGRRAFTLVELLTVIGIIAVLAGLLFPVFQGVREDGRRAACASNLRQIGMAVSQYMADYDGGFPPPLQRAPRLSWAGFVQPYVRNWQVFRCPNLVEAGLGGRSVWAPPLNVPSNLSVWPAYGWNLNYLAPAQADCSDFHKAFDGSGPPTNEAQVAHPAGTVMVVGISIAAGPGSWSSKSTLYPVRGGFCTAPAPASVGSRDACTFPDSGWGAGSFLGPSGGFESERHRGRGNVLFVDGHLRTMTAEQLAAGTNWSPTTPNNQVVITDRSKYLWDLM